ncbi:MAG: NTP transferase domain-containing protein [Gaiellales bacterium]|nr:NTP transferase domain-containing protein [Gaiellales bacterium]
MNAPLSTIVVLAAGLGTRMRSSAPKVLHQVCGLPIISHVLRAAAQVEAQRTVVVLGSGHELVRPVLPPACRTALQEVQKGTGHAVLAAAGEIGGGALMVLAGDTPLLRGDVLRQLAEDHASSGCDATVLTMRLADPSGYGRVIRDDRGEVRRIVEHRDASADELAVDEVNSGIYVLPAVETLEILRSVGHTNAQGEVYLTDVIEGLARRGAVVGAFAAPDPTDVLGVNTRVELAQAEAIMKARLLRQWMLAGVTVENPETVSIHATVELEPDVTLLTGTSLYGRTVVGEGSEIGPGTTLDGAIVGRRCRLPHCCVANAEVEEGTVLPPFSWLGGPGAP